MLVVKMMKLKKKQFHQYKHILPIQQQQQQQQQNGYVT